MIRFLKQLNLISILFQNGCVNWRSSMRGVKITLRDERKKGKEHVFQFKGGIVSFVQYLNETKTAIIKKPVYFHTSTKGSVDVEIALEYIDTYTETVFTYANNINTREGGTHYDRVQVRAHQGHK